MVKYLAKTDIFVKYLKSISQLLCMLAWAGLTLGAPYQRIDNTELIVEKVIILNKPSEKAKNNNNNNNNMTL